MLVDDFAVAVEQISVGGLHCERTLANEGTSGVTKNQRRGDNDSAQHDAGCGCYSSARSHGAGSTTLAHWQLAEHLRRVHGFDACRGNRNVPGLFSRTVYSTTQCPFGT